MTLKLLPKTKGDQRNVDTEFAEILGGNTR